ncbi:MAG: hypothetical protein L0H93_18865, partial [Nocardioides sp.]|nr:hypothetical protein [Nocardioides sp.]
MTRARKADLRTASQNLLTVEVTDLPEPTVLQGRLDRINHELGSPSMRVLHHRKLPLMCEELAVPRSGSAVSVGLTHSRLVVAAHHEHVDESGMLEVLGRLSGHPISSKLDPRAPLPASSAKSGPSPGPSPGLAPSHYRNDL